MTTVITAEGAADDDGPRQHCWQETTLLVSVPNSALPRWYTCKAHCTFRVGMVLPAPASCGPRREVIRGLTRRTKSPGRN